MHDASICKVRHAKFFMIFESVHMDSRIPACAEHMINCTEHRMRCTFGFLPADICKSICTHAHVATGLWLLNGAGPNLCFTSEDLTDCRQRTQIFLTDRVDGDRVDKQQHKSLVIHWIISKLFDHDPHGLVSKKCRTKLFLSRILHVYSSMLNNDSIL